MDTSETFIKMCEKAEEIQNWDNLQDGDYYWYEPNGNVICIYSYHMNRAIKLHLADKSFPLGKIVFLPRQDQLQAMVDLCGRWFTVSINFSESVPKQLEWSGKTSNWFVRAYSMEQLWLAFVMKEKFGKVWSNDEWIKDRQ